MGLGRQVEDGAGPSFRHDARHRGLVGDVSLEKRDPGIGAPGFDATQVGRVRQLVDDHHRLSRVLQDVVDQIGADEARTTSNQDCFHAIETDIVRWISPEYTPVSYTHLTLPTSDLV